MVDIKLKELALDAIKGIGQRPSGDVETPLTLDAQFRENVMEKSQGGSAELAAVIGNRMDPSVFELTLMGINSAEEAGWQPSWLLESPPVTTTMGCCEYLARTATVGAVRPVMRVAVEFDGVSPPGTVHTSMSLQTALFLSIPPTKTA